jgi:hypothetical protein
LFNFSLIISVGVFSSSAAIRSSLQDKIRNCLTTESTARQSRTQKPLATEGTETTEPKIKSSKQKDFQNPHSSLSTVSGGEGRVRGSESRKRLNKI